MKVKNIIGKVRPYVVATYNFTRWVAIATAQKVGCAAITFFRWAQPKAAALLYRAGYVVLTKEKYDRLLDGPPIGSAASIGVDTEWSLDEYMKAVRKEKADKVHYVDLPGDIEHEKLSPTEMFQVVKSPYPAPPDS